MKGLVSFSLFGNTSMYNVGALRNVQIWKDSPFDVDCRFYVGKSVSQYYRRTLEAEGAQVVLVPEAEDQTATFWRWEAFQSDYDYVLSRDTDSRPNEREFWAIREWLESGKNFHVIRDHPYHGVPVLAGLFGCKRPLFGLMTEKLPSLPPKDFYTVINEACRPKKTYESNDFYQVDQWWLRLHLYPRLRNDVFAHDEFFAFERRRYRHSLPARPADNEFIGEGWNEFDQPRFPEHRDLFNGWPRKAYYG